MRATPIVETIEKEADSTPKSDDFELLLENVAGKSIAPLDEGMMTTPRRVLWSMQGGQTSPRQCRASGARSTDWTDIEASVADTTANVANNTLGGTAKNLTPN